MRSTLMLKFALTLLCLFWLTPALSEQPTYELSMRVFQDGNEIASPRMLVEKGAEASISLSGDHELAVGLAVEDHGAQEVHVLAEVETATGSLSPELLVRKGEWAAVAVDDLEFRILVKDYPPKD